MLETTTDLLPTVTNMLLPYAEEYKWLAPVGMVKGVKLFPLSLVIDSHPSLPTVKNRLLPNVIPYNVSSVVPDPDPDHSRGGVQRHLESDHAGQ